LIKDFLTKSNVTTIIPILSKPGSSDFLPVPATEMSIEETALL
jgi:hypothetical protein